MPSQSEVQTAIYQIVRESLTNVVKHARDASTVDVVLDCGPQAVGFSIVDDGGPAPAAVGERDVFHLIASGLTNAEIAGRLFLTEATVKTHITRILAELQLRDRVQVVIFAYETGCAGTAPSGQLPSAASFSASFS